MRDIGKELRAWVAEAAPDTFTNGMVRDAIEARTDRSPFTKGERGALSAELQELVDMGVLQRVRAASAKRSATYAVRQSGTPALALVPKRGEVAARNKANLVIVLEGLLRMITPLLESQPPSQSGAWELAVESVVPEDLLAEVRAKRGVHFALLNARQWGLIGYNVRTITVRRAFTLLQAADIKAVVEQITREADTDRRAWSQQKKQAAAVGT